MSDMMRRKLHSLKGFARLHLILLILVAVMLVVVAIPIVRHYVMIGDEIGCLAGLDTAQRRLAVDYLSGNYDQTAEEAKAVITHAMNGWDDLCPGGGSVYIVDINDPNNELPYKVVCGIHNKDLKERTRYNASFVLDQLQEKLRLSRVEGEPYPETLEVVLNSQTLTAHLVDSETGIVRGTKNTIDAEGIVISYSIVGHSDFGKNTGVEEGHIWYFSFADEDHCANWSAISGLTGDSYIKN